MDHYFKGTRTNFTTQTILQMIKSKSLLILMIILISGFSLIAQTPQVEPTDLMHSNGKIYVVVAVVVTILLGLFFYVFNLDRKISKMEKERES